MRTCVPSMHPITQGKPAYNFSCRWKCDKPIFEGTQLADNGLYHSGNSTFIDAESVPHGLDKIAGRQVP
ncbi:hypothetical protein DPMN_175403 [Dreissena polymorpha]|uniref:Uncharacterized protein n=1 Tax=Dreissena polymorpha TaxID=45954 RepID=A0A9D4E9A8_DREPO|nr:hypothetical protein DPMN_175403 [Dreissena polymorpha]